MKLLLTLSGLLFSLILLAQNSNSNSNSDLINSAENNQVWKYYNRKPAFIMKEKGKIDCIFLDAKQGDGLAVYQDLEFENGIIALDIKGKDILQQSFVGVAFHIQNDSTFNAVYFRPFNFKRPERTSHSVQYISHPSFTWQKLRTEFPEQYEKTVTPVPNPDEFFRVRIEVNWPVVRVFVENAEMPSLEVKMLSTFRKGKIGLWVGNSSDGSFRNLTVKKSN